jgi:transcriptional regulator with XRE-family HTH domain
MMSDMLTLGKRLRFARLLRDKRQKDVAEALNVARSSLSHWEKDAYEPSLKEISAIASYLSVSAVWLTHGQAEMSVSDYSTTFAPNARAKGVQAS